MSGQRILLIEDDRWLADSYIHVLHTEYDVEVVHNSAEALDRIDDDPFDLIIADVMLESGLVIDLLHELQSHADMMGIPVILCTSLASSFRAEDLINYGVVAVLDKASLTPDELRISAQRALSPQAYE